MSRYKGTVAQSTLDWYAGKAQSAQQWFSQSAANYWAFTLQNNSADGTRLWIYDAEAVSGAAFPAGTGNPGGNPGAVAGYQGGSGSPSASFNLVSSAALENNTVNSLAVPAPSAIVAGNLLLAVLICGEFAASFIKPPDSSWVLMGSADGDVNHIAIALFGKIATASEPASYTFTTTGAPAQGMLGQIFNWSGNQNPGYLDVAGSTVSTSAGTSIIAPGVNTSAGGDLVFAVIASIVNGQVITGDPSYTLSQRGAGYISARWIGYKTLSNAGSSGTFNGSMTTANGWGIVTVAIKASTAGSAPGQVLAAPIQSVAPLKPGIFTLGFSAQALGLSGITRWLPPAGHFEWHRESPLAVIDPNTNFNLAGIAPEAAAWGSLTWLAIK